MSDQNSALNLVEWQRREIESLRRLDFETSQVRDVTVLAYYFRPAECFDDGFWRTEFAFLKTFQTQGLLPAVLVVNRTSELVEAFCRKHDIKVQVEPSLIPGNISTMALDMVSELHRRFSTKYVLIVQDDGFPLRPGLERFVGMFDYIGAVWERHNTFYDFYPEAYRVGNGGFSLRSRALCAEASRLYRRWFSWLPYWWYLLGDDTFYCKTLRFWFPGYRRNFKWAMMEDAAEFSSESGCWLKMGVESPLGFHGAEGWSNVQKVKGGLL